MVPYLLAVSLECVEITRRIVRDHMLSLYLADRRVQTDAELADLAFSVSEYLIGDLVDALQAKPICRAVFDRVCDEHRKHLDAEIRTTVGQLHDDGSVVVDAAQEGKLVVDQNAALSESLQLGGRFGAQLIGMNDVEDDADLVPFAQVEKCVRHEARVEDGHLGVEPEPTHRWHATKAPCRPLQVFDAAREWVSAGEDDFAYVGMLPEILGDVADRLRGQISVEILLSRVRSGDVGSEAVLAMADAHVRREV